MGRMRRQFTPRAICHAFVTPRAARSHAAVTVEADTAAHAVRHVGPNKRPRRAMKKERNDAAVQYIHWRTTAWVPRPAAAGGIGQEDRRSDTPGVSWQYCKAYRVGVAKYLPPDSGPDRQARDDLDGLLRVRAGGVILRHSGRADRRATPERPPLPLLHGWGCVLPARQACSEYLARGIGLVPVAFQRAARAIVRLIEVSSATSLGSCRPQALGMTPRLQRRIWQIRGPLRRCLNPVFARGRRRRYPTGLLNRASGSQRAISGNRVTMATPMHISTKNGSAASATRPIEWPVRP